MQVAGMILGCLLVGQAPDILLPPPTGQEKRSPAVLEPTIKAAAAGDVSSAASAPVSSKPAPGRLSPPEMVATAMVLPPGSTLTGQPWTLFNVLSATADRRQQLEMTRAYWRLVQAVAEYHFCGEHAGRLARMKSPGGDAATRLAQASAAAMLRQAELEATEAQYELARLLRLPAGAALPLPADRPHVGAYRTNFQALFAGRIPPEPAALMDRILPIQRRAIDEQATAVQAAEDVLAAATDQQLSSRGDMADVLACSRELLRQQRALVANRVRLQSQHCRIRFGGHGACRQPASPRGDVDWPPAAGRSAGLGANGGSQRAGCRPDAASSPQRLEDERTDACPAA